MKKPRKTTLEFVVRVRVECDPHDTNRVAFNLGTGLNSFRGITRKQAEARIKKYLKVVVGEPF